MSHVLGALLASSPLLAQAWTRCLRADAGSANFVIDRSDDAVFITFSRTQAVTSSSGLGRGFFEPVSVYSDTHDIFAPLGIGEEDDGGKPQPLLLQASALRLFMSLYHTSEFQNYSRVEDAYFYIICSKKTAHFLTKRVNKFQMAPKPLDYESLNENVKKVAYAVRGELYLRASELQKEGKKVVALCQAPFLLDDPNVGLLFPVDIIARAKHYLSLNSGGLGMFNQTIRLLEAGIELVYVFDGQPPELKKQELAKRLVFIVLSLSPSFFFCCKIMIIFKLILFFRYLKRKDATNDLNTTIETGDLEGIEKYNKRTVKVTKQHNEDCKRLLRLMGVPTIEAPCEAEAQCAALCKSDKVFVVASENMDTLTFGVPRFLRHLMDPSSKKISVMESDVSKVLEELRLTMDQFIDLCILFGCDYCYSIKGRAIREA
ncbi:hypothetical protein ZIOFF_021850 [Zingiber officinale]|uniref:XPG-I domain-containing protein n=1 Tax=Zingiber officinale TaxID=94328 RepID=A0A8J5LH57_ZINOF|nr:hypothetical protein ZIOFF_021850 [Zingiber officinale]